jgi:hypothetical protein
VAAHGTSPRLKPDSGTIRAPADLGRSKVAWKLFVSDTRFIGSSLFLQGQAELGFGTALYRYIGLARYERLVLSVSYVGDVDLYDAFSFRVGVVSKEIDPDPSAKPTRRG